MSFEVPELKKEKKKKKKEKQNAHLKTINKNCMKHTHKKNQKAFGIQLGHTPAIQYTKINPYPRQAHIQMLAILEMAGGELLLH